MIFSFHCRLKIKRVRVLGHNRPAAGQRQRRRDTISRSVQRFIINKIKVISFAKIVSPAQIERDRVYGAVPLHEAVDRQAGVERGGRAQPQNMPIKALAARRKTHPIELIKAGPLKIARDTPLGRYVE